MTTYHGNAGQDDLKNAPRLLMAAYFYSFSETDCRAVDEILSAVASAGKGHHHTEYWGDPIGGDGLSYVDQIQAAAVRTANRIEGQQAEIERLRIRNMGTWKAAALKAETDAARYQKALQYIAEQDWAWAGAPSTGDSHKQYGSLSKIATNALAAHDKASP